MRDSLVGVRFGGVPKDEEKVLKSALKSWADLHEKYRVGRESHSDVGYWINENANVSILVSAFNKTDRLISIAESTEKRAGGRSELGRADAYVSYLNRKTGAEEWGMYVEAKMFWSKSRQTDLFRLSKVGALGQLEKACADLEGLKTSCSGFGVCFFVPRIFSEKQMRFSQEEIQKYANEMIENSNVSCVAWFFPKAVKGLKGTDGLFYPGVILLGRLIDEKSEQ